jgi:hypothetical protein
MASTPQACRTAVRLAALAWLMLAAGGPAAADGEVCRYGSQSYQPAQNLCLDGVPYTCQDNGAWVSDRMAPCVDPVYTNKPRSCRITTNRFAAEGVKACIQGKNSQCSEGAWVDLGQRC